MYSYLIKVCRLLWAVNAIGADLVLMGNTVGPQYLQEGMDERVELLPALSLHALSHRYANSWWRRSWENWRGVGSWTSYNHLAHGGQQPEPCGLKGLCIIMFPEN